MRDVYADGATSRLMRSGAWVATLGEVGRELKRAFDAGYDAAREQRKK
jgi:hypothetical protein